MVGIGILSLLTGLVSWSVDSKFLKLMLQGGYFFEESVQLILRPLLVLAALGAVGAANAVVITFESLAQNNANVNDDGTFYNEQGYHFEQGAGEPFHLSSFGTQEARYPGSTALFDNTVAGIVTLTKIGGGAFDLRSIDLANLNGPNSVTVTFTNDRAQQIQFTKVDTQFPLTLQTFNFGAVGVGITSISWSQDAPFHQFDNVNIVPEPATMAALGLGLVAIAARRRRKA